MQHRLNGQDIPANSGPGKPGNNPDLIGVFGQTIAKLFNARVVFERCLVDLNGLVLVKVERLNRLARQIGDFALQITHPSFPGVVAHQTTQGAVRDTNLFFGQSVRLELAGDEVTAGDFDLFFFGVARKPYDLHAVNQRTWHIGEFAVVMNKTLERS